MKRLDWTVAAGILLWPGTSFAQAAPDLLVQGFLPLLVLLLIAFFGGRALLRWGRLQSAGGPSHGHSGDSAHRVSSRAPQNPAESLGSGGVPAVVSL